MNFRNLIYACFLFSLPGAFVLAALAMLGYLSWGVMLLTLPFLMFAVVMVVKPAMGDFRRVAAYARRLRDREEAEPPRDVDVEAAAELSSLFTQLASTHNRRVEALEAATASNAMIFDNLPTAVVILDDNRDVVGHNKAAAKLFRTIDKGHDITRHIRDPIVLDCIDEVLEGGDPVAETELVLSTDTQRHYDVLVARLPDEAPEGQKLVLTFSDLTELRKIEQMRADFAADAGHELRTPLTVVLGIIETLEGVGKDDPNALPNFLPIMRDQATRMQRLVEDLLSLARIELNEHTPPSGAADVGQIIQKVVAGLEVKATDKGMTLVIDQRLEQAVTIGDDGELGQIFQNLIDNGIKYSKRDTQITISLYQPRHLPPAVHRYGHDRVMAVAVKDSGDGIAKEHLPRLTERFYRVDTNRSREEGGTGLGLAIVKHLVQRHRGHLAIDSKMGKGSTFTVYLPSRREKPQLRLIG